jgi:hypothetical protein
MTPHPGFVKSRWCFLALLALFSLPVLQAQGPQTPDPKAVPVISGDIGPCSADFTVTDSAGAPVYAATIQVHIAYGFLSAYKLDLEVGTNADGKSRFTGLPAKSKHGLFFRASKGPREGSAFDDTAKTCKAEFTIALEEKQPAAKLQASSGMFPLVPRLLTLGLRFPQPLLAYASAFAYDYSHLDVDGTLASSAGVGLGIIRGKTT